MATDRKVVSSVFRPSLFAGKTAIVTGGGTGLGKAITLELLHLGCQVMIASRKVENLIKAAEEMRRSITGCRVEVLECNIRKEEQVKHLVSETLNKFGKIDFVVNNGGGQFVSPASSISTKGWHAVIDTNLTGTFMVCREVYNQWMRDHGGVIVNMLVDMFRGCPTMSHSGAARAGIENLTKSFAIEWAESGVRVNAVAPGSSFPSETAAANYGTDDSIFSEQIPRIPAKRLGAPEEVSAAVCFLLSPAAAFISGETIKVDGAQHLYSTTLPWHIPDHKKIPAYTWKEDIKKSRL